MRVVAATNRDLHQMVEDGKFREDLWVPPQRGAHRHPPAARTARGRAAAGALLPEQVQRAVQPHGEAHRVRLKVLQEYTWPGNVRQLQHLMERLTILAPGDPGGRRGGGAGAGGHGVAGKVGERPWRRRKRSRSAACWRPPAATRAAPPRFWASSARRSIASWSGWASSADPAGAALPLIFPARSEPIQNCAAGCILARPGGWHERER